MKEELISFQTSKLAKEKGFNWKCLNSYDSDGHLKFNTYLNKEDKCFNNKCDVCYSGPTQSLLQKWLREYHGLHVNINTNYFDGFYYSFDIFKLDYIEYHNSFDTYEQALEAGLLEALKQIKL